LFHIPEIKKEDEARNDVLCMGAKQYPSSSRGVRRQFFYVFHGFSHALAFFFSSLVPPRNSKEHTTPPPACVLYAQNF
jgi:hypothetical protein